MNLMSAVGGISDRHITEFAYASPKRGRIKLFMKIASAAACLAVIIGVIAAVRLAPGIGSGSNYPVEVLPHVYFNDRAYIIYGRSSHGFSELPDGYVQVGEITTTDHNNKKVNGYGEMLRIGEKIYQNPDFPEDIYVYTTLFTGGERYWYLLFTDHTYERVRINGKTYVWDYSHENRYRKDLHSGYVLIGEVTTNDRDNRYTDGYGQELNIGDKIYQSPYNPDVVYVYTNIFLNDDYYVRFAVDDTLSDDDTSSIDDMSSVDLPVEDLPFPQVIINGEKYIVGGGNSPDDCFKDSLPDGYELIGEVTCSGKNDRGKEGFGAGFAVGNKVYQHPDDPSEVYVYTTFMTGGERYWYVRCVKSDKHNREAEDRGESVNR